jgi:signal transduction histidine kinase
MRIYNYSGSAIVVALALILLVPVLAYFQFLWLGQLSDRELDRMHANLRATGMRLRIDLHDAFLDPLRKVGGHLEGPEDIAARELVDRLRRWNSSASHPGVIGDVYLVTTEPHGTTRSVKKLDLQEQRFVWSTWPPDSSEWVADLRDRDVWMESESEPGRPQYVLRTLGGFALPLRSEGTRYQRDGAAGTPPGEEEQKSYVIVQYRWDYVRNTVLPALLQTYVESREKDEYEYILVDRKDTARVLWSSPPNLDVMAFAVPDAAVAIGELPRVIFSPPSGQRQMSQGGPPPGGGFPGLDSSAQRRFGPRAGERGMGPGGGGRYELRMKHRAGSLEVAVGHHRLRNLAISFGIIALLAGSVLMLLMAAHRSQDLARQQIEFVAGVSHELRTPLAVLKSVGENLADGVITGRSRTREYGALVAREVHRLAAIVDNALEYAGIQSGRRIYEMQETSPLAILKSSLRECEGIIAQADMKLDLSVAEEIPKIMADASALQIALQNVIANGIKYGRDGKWLGIQLAPELRPDQEYVAYVVSDRGIGIDPDDQEKIFEAFYRGKNTHGIQVQGSGLGLSLTYHIVQAHHGLVEVTSAPGKGSTFTLLLPAVESMKG